MATKQNAVTQDPLGLKRFALTESAYDLANSLQGIYGRLSYTESQTTNPDKNLMFSWRNRSKEIGRAYRRFNGEDLVAIEEFINIATNEWKQLTKLESERIVVSSHAN